MDISKVKNVFPVNISFGLVFICMGHCVKQNRRHPDFMDYRYFMVCFNYFLSLSCVHPLPSMTPFCEGK